MHRAVKETKEMMKGTMKASKTLQSRKRKGLKDNAFFLFIPPPPPPPPPLSYAFMLYYTKA